MAQNTNPSGLCDLDVLITQLLDQTVAVSKIVRLKFAN